ncbi:HEAT repeat domain-containing protein [Streptomyces sp. HUAS ZL42]|uniref:HEAT repeat domain-containing protein n=1 Tax=Streptomyces sp. HUAS ZL42 TaxID=3231715 RepID=UPI00345F073F
MITTDVVTGVLLCLMAAVPVLGLLIAGLRGTRRLRQRGRERIAAPVRPLLLELLCAEEDEQDELLSRFAALDRRTWAALEPTVAEMLGKVDGAARTVLVRLYGLRGAAADAEAELDARSAPRRGRAAETLGRLRHRPAVPALCRLLADRDAEVRLVAARALGRIGEPSAVPALLEALHGPRNVPPAVVTRALTSFGAQTLRSVAAGMDHPEPLVRAVAIEVLGASGGVPQTPGIVRALAEDPHPEVRIKAARALGRLGMPDGLQPLLAAVGPGRPTALRIVATGALGTLGAVAATPRLQDLLGDSEPRVAATAARSLLRLGPAGETALRAAAEDRPDQPAAAQARSALAESAVAGSILDVRVEVAM